VSEPASRQERLLTRLERIRERRTERGPSDRWMLVVGGTLMPLGLACVVLGWVGVTHTVYVYDQLTYIASGSLVGIALVVLGGFVYFTYWQTVRVREARTQHEEDQAVLLRIEALLSTGAPQTSGLVATPSGTMVHRATCAVVRGRRDLVPVPVGTDREPCALCEPFAVVEG
jgi:hypothetical protein